MMGGAHRAKLGILSTMTDDAKTRAGGRAGPTTRRRGFTLVELLVVITIIGILVSLLMPAVQMARESARQTQCRNNLKQLALACRSYETNHGVFAPGHTDYGGNEHSWMTLILPFIEQQALYDLYDFDKRWSHAANRPVKETDLAMQLCPSANRQDKGQGDYAGMNGSRGLPGLPSGYPVGHSYHAGMMIAVGPSLGNAYLRAGGVRDGLSHTLMIVESAGRTDGNRFWADAHQTFAQHGPLGVSSNNEMFSQHPNGVMVAFADGRVAYIPTTVPLTVIDKLSTRARGEQVDSVKFQ